MREGETVTAEAETGGSATATVVGDEIRRFSALADEWWDPDGKFRPLHALNPARADYIRARAAAHFGRDPQAERPFAGLTLLDIGCGGGLISEPMARLGADVVAIDASATAIEVARAHAARDGLAIDFRCAAPENMPAAHFDVVLTLEVVEHVASLEAFFAVSARLLRPNGVLVAATLNRTLKSLALAKIGAEYVLRWLPVGTHDWRKFVRPSELASSLRRQGIDVIDIQGLSYAPLTGVWRLSRDLDVNYIACAVKRRS
jgi:2-polyprenyl-6-hydroxyphenyl methylase/3-demethylubiquinone-9 3-methyltransferase